MSTSGSRKSGVAAEYMDGETAREDREATFARFRAGETRVICNVGVLVAGVDLPMAACLIDARPTKSRIRYVQVIGRGLRTSPGKVDLRILDHAGNALRLGLVTDIHQTCLDDGEEKAAARKQREQAEPLPKLCATCKAVLSRAERVCFACGEPVRVLTTVREIAGDLVELGARQSGKREIPEWERRRFYSRAARAGRGRAATRRAGRRTSSRKNSPIGRTATTGSRWSRRSRSATG